jgi:hypothetical protein
MMDVATQRRMERHKWAQLASIKREANKVRPRKDRPRPQRSKCRPRYWLLGEQSCRYRR